MDNGCLHLSNFERALALIGEEQYNVAELALAKFFLWKFQWVLRRNLVHRVEGGSRPLRLRKLRRCWASYGMAGSRPIIIRGWSARSPSKTLLRRLPSPTKSERLPRRRPITRICTCGGAPVLLKFGLIRSMDLRKAILF